MSVPLLLGDYAFRPVARADLPLLRAWLATPHVREWWGDPEHETALIAEGLEFDWIVSLLVAYRSEPFAYLQHYDVFAEGAQMPYPDAPAGTRAIDFFVGRADMIGRGHGSGLLRALSDHLLAAGTPLVLIDPDPRNLRAVAAYRKAGFRELGLRTDEHGTALLMARAPERIA